MLLYELMKEQKKYFLTFCVAYIGVLTSYNQSIATPSRSINAEVELDSISCPISPNTKEITYQHHSNSGLAISTTITIREDCLIWEYNETRNNCCLKDSCKYGKIEFEELVKGLSQIQFSILQRVPGKCGGSGHSYRFESDSSRDFNYHSDDRLAGDYKQAESLIQQFINAHKTDCEMLLEELSRWPYERGEFGRFKTLPKVLEKYQVKGTRYL